MYQTKNFGAAQAASIGDAKATCGSGFFAVDRCTWRRVIELGLNAAVTYLVLARGSGGDNATTAWSTDAIERYTGISRHRAKDAIQLLRDSGVLDQRRGGTRPLRKIKASHEIQWSGLCRMELTPDEKALRDRLPLTVESFWTDEDEENSYLELEEMESLSESQARTLKRITEGEYNLTRDELELSAALVRKGHARWERDWNENRRRLLAFDGADGEVDLIWLPNALVDGVAGETAPIELIRQTRSAGLLRVFVEFYHVHSLIRHGGLDPTITCGSADAKIEREYGAYNVWAFRPNGGALLWFPLHSPFDWEKPDWWVEDETGEAGKFNWLQHIKTLEELGLIEAVPVLYEAEDRDAEAIHPVAFNVSEGLSTPAERRLAASARKAALAMLPALSEHELQEWILVPVPRHIRKASVRGIYRLRYRPHTSATAQWFSKDEKWSKLADKFDAIEADVRGRAALAA